MIRAAAAAALAIGLLAPSTAVLAQEPDAAPVAAADNAILTAYREGCAAFAAGDHATAFRRLARLAPFDQPRIGFHARYLIARIHHLAGERPEAMENYKAAVAEFDRQRKSALGRLADAALSQQQRDQYEKIARGQAPEEVARALFWWGVVLAEFGEADEAASKYAYAIMLRPSTPLAAEARLRGGICAVEAGKPADALALLTPIASHPRFGVEALRWTAKAQYGVGATPIPKGRGFAAVMNARPDPDRLAQGIKDAIQSYQAAQHRLQAQLEQSPPDGNLAGELSTILMELGDMQQLDHAYKDAAQSYAQAQRAAGRDENAEQAALLRRAIALQLAGDFAGSDEACQGILQRFSGSTPAAEAQIRYAENALLSSDGGQGQDMKDASARLMGVIEKHPKTREAYLAQYRLAELSYVGEQYQQAEAALQKIPAEQRNGDLLRVGLLLADCQMRQLPQETPEDALSTARLLNRIEKILTPLEAYTQSRPFDPDTPDALLRVGYLANRMQQMLADPVEKRRALTKSRRAYMNIVQEFAGHRLVPVAMLENAKLLLTYAGAAPAINELSKFTGPPLDQSAIAPLAVMHLADAMRQRRKSEDAATLLGNLRQRVEDQLLKDPRRAQWAQAMRFAHALALKEAGRYDQSRALLESIAQFDARRPQGQEALWRLAQCRLDPAMLQIESARGALLKANRAAALAEALARVGELCEALRAAAGELDATAQKLAETEDESPIVQRMRHDSAWAWRTLGEVEIEAQRRQARLDAAHKIVADAEKAAAADADAARPQNGKRRRPESRSVRTLDAALASTPLPELSLERFALTPAEKTARERFTAVIDGPDAALAAQARIELAELHAQRGELPPAIDLLSEAVAFEEQNDIVERLRVRLAELYLAGGDAKQARTAAEPVLEAGGRNNYATYARAVMLESLYRLGQWEGVIEQGSAIAGAERSSRLYGVTDLAMLRMAEAQQKLGRWEQSRTTLEGLIGRFGRSSTLLAEAREELATTYEKLNQADQAAAVRAELEKSGARGKQAPAGSTERLMPRIPNLLVSGSRRSNWSVANPVGQPAPPVMTAAVNNPDGTGRFEPLPMICREIEVEVAPPPRALPFDQAPYVKSAAAADEPVEPEL